MRHVIKVVACIGVAILVIVFARSAVYFAAPLFEFVHYLVFVLTSLVCIVRLPVAAYQYANGDRSENVKMVPIACVVWFVCAATQPRVDKSEVIRVFGVTREFDVKASTREVLCYCLDDAKTVARDLYKNRANWSRNDEGEFTPSDVQITIVRKNSALDWINNLFGTRYGTSVTDLSIRYLDDNEDPLHITSASDYFEADWRE